ncbi:hypothetical protein [Pseudomonas segetis]|uniref:Uncharacterized protein n=1 Tax=Pseudomonas segetis TaxID=298908 RepID=A0A239CBU3_9PSED|nr:hypothetical protein [Pseudomonas segetis]SNS16924.1 hypothetical protein SAMN05216255_1587 [Pseudomonas segetis]
MTQPKGSMCASCARKHKDCSALPFDKMKVIKVYGDGVKAVRCTEYRSDKA